MLDSAEEEAGGFEEEIVECGEANPFDIIVYKPTNSFDKLEKLCLLVEVNTTASVDAPTQETDRSAEDAWLAGVTTNDGGDGLAAAKSSLGL